VHLAVRDYVPGLVQLVGAAGPTERSGRGLLIVDALSNCWGCTPTPDGKVMWATMRIRQLGQR